MLKKICFYSLCILHAFYDIFKQKEDVSVISNSLNFFCCICDCDYCYGILKFYCVAGSMCCANAHMLLPFLLILKCSFLLWIALICVTHVQSNTVWTEVFANLKILLGMYCFGVSDVVTEFVLCCKHGLAVVFLMILLIRSVVPFMYGGVLVFRSLSFCFLLRVFDVVLAALMICPLSLYKLFCCSAFVCFLFLHLYFG